MNLTNLFVGLDELKANKLRTLLSMMGIIFGVSAVISMLSIGEGAKQETIEQIEMLGTNNIYIKAKAPSKTKSAKSVSNFSPGLNISDVNSLKEINAFAQYVIPQREENMDIFYKTYLKSIMILGTTPDCFKALNLRLESGRFFGNQDFSDHSDVCVIGFGLKNKIFGIEEAIGKKIKVGNLWFTVTGVLEEKELFNSLKDSKLTNNFDNGIIIPFTTMVNKIISPTNENNNRIVLSSNVILRGFNNNQQSIKNGRKSVDQIVIKVGESSSVIEASDLTSRILERRHNGIDDYEIIIPEKLLAQKQKTQRTFNIVMGAIAGLSLLVGGIGIMNVTLTNILERTKEIGVRRAVGARKNDILFQFLFEAVIVCNLGGIIGLFLGYILTLFIADYAGWRTIVTPFSVIISLFVSITVGLIFGTYPAVKASRCDPVTSLRHE
jgi:putative ABC transport system permease protein